jgi:uncharacterized membrane protein
MFNNINKYGAITLSETDKVISTFGTNISYGGCVGGLIGLWFFFRIATVVSLTL